MTGTDYVLVPREQLEELVAEVRLLTARVTEALDAAAPVPEGEAPGSEVHPGFSRFRQRMGGNRG